MKAWVDDQDRWPAGFGGGLLTSELRLRARHLLITRKSYGEHGGSKQSVDSWAWSGRTGNGRLREYGNTQR